MIADFYDAILEGYDHSPYAALDYAAGMVWSECETTNQYIPYLDYIGTVNGVDIWYCYGADHYCFSSTDEV